MMSSALKAIEVNAPFEIGNDPITLLSRDGANLILNGSFQFSDCFWPVFVYFCFQEPPQMKIQGVQVWRMRCPVRGTASADDPVLKVVFQPCQSHICTMWCGSVLLQPLNPFLQNRINNVEQKPPYRWKTVSHCYQNHVNCPIF